ncbi:MAG: hypothetical protein R2736_02575 [Solirubrobacterales bacterium]
MRSTTAFHPLPDQGDPDARFTVLARLRPDTATAMLPALEELRATLGEGTRVLTVGPAADLLVARGCPQGIWEASHQVTAGGLALAQLFNSVDVYVDATTDDLTGRDVLAAMACGAVPVVGGGHAGVEVSRSGRSAVVVSAGGNVRPNGTQATVDLAADWPRFRRLRHHALSTSAQQGLIGGGHGLSRDSPAAGSAPRGRHGRATAYLDGSRHGSPGRRSLVSLGLSRLSGQVKGSHLAPSRPSLAC